MVYGDCGICIEEVISLDSVQNLGFCLSPYRAETFSKFQTAKEKKTCLHISSLTGDPMHISNISVMYVERFEKIQQKL